MSFLIGLLLTIAWSLYYCCKGISFGNSQRRVILMIITFLLAAALFYLASYVELKIIKYAIFAYCLWSFWRYVMLMKKKRMPEISRFYSGITVVEKEITIHYSIPRFLLLIPVNLMLFLWKNIFLRWDDSVLIDVKTKDGTIVCIKL